MSSTDYICLQEWLPINLHKFLIFLHKAAQTTDFTANSN